MTATSTPRPTLTIHYMSPSASPSQDYTYATATSADGIETVIDLEYSDYLIDTVSAVARALGAEVVETNEHLRPHRRARLTCRCGAVDRFSCICGTDGGL